MPVSWYQSCAQKTTFVGQAEEKMMAHLVEITFEGSTLLVSMDGVLGGIYLDDGPPPVPALKQGAGGSIDGVSKVL